VACRFGAVVREWKAFLAGDAANVAAMPQSSPMDGPTLSGHTRWLDVPLPNLGVQSYSTRFSQSVVVSVPVDGATTDGVTAFIAVAFAGVDSAWSHQTAPDPAVPPMSHIVNARTSRDWVKHNSGHTVRGRTYFVGQVRSAVVRALVSGRLVTAVR
jgi:hypothetical protein